MTHASRAELRADLLAKVPRWYSPTAHLLIPPLSALGVAAFAVSRIQDLRLWQAALVPLFLLLANAVEWHLHRGPMHRRTRFLEAMYLRHTPVHHALYVSDAMAIHSARELRFVLLPGYGMLAVLAAASPVAFGFFAVGQPNLAALLVATAAAYLVAYEALHLACHLPDSSWVGRLVPVQRLRRHHQLHHASHLMPRWNFNVTVPVWDLVRGTVYPGRTAPAAAAVPVRRAR